MSAESLLALDEVAGGVPDTERANAAGLAEGTSPTALAYFAAHPDRPHVYFGDYLLLQTLGEGEFGKVKLGVHRVWGEETAIKLIKRERVVAAEGNDDAGKLSKVEREIQVLKELRHPNIVHLYEVIESERYIGIVLEYGAGGELFDYILAHKCLKERDACRLFAQLVSGVSYLHRKNIIHRDLKLENLLLDRHRNVIITDFGFANNFSARENDLMATSCGSPCYAAPELVVQDGVYVGAAVDVWSCGVILYAMLAGYLPFDDDPANPEGDNINLLYKYIMATPLTFPDYIGEEPRSLLRRMLVPDPAERATLDEVMAHPWLAPYRDVFRFSVQELEQAAIEQQAKKRQVYRDQMQQHMDKAARLPRSATAVLTPEKDTVPHSASVGDVPARAADIPLPVLPPFVPMPTAAKRKSVEPAESTQEARASTPGAKPRTLSNGVGAPDLALSSYGTAKRSGSSRAARRTEHESVARSNSAAKPMRPEAVVKPEARTKRAPAPAPVPELAPAAQAPAAPAPPAPTSAMPVPAPALTDRAGLAPPFLFRASLPHGALATPQFGQAPLSLTSYIPQRLGEPVRGGAEEKRAVVDERRVSVLDARTPGSEPEKRAPEDRAPPADLGRVPPKEDEVKKLAPAPTRTHRPRPISMPMAPPEMGAVPTAPSTAAPLAPPRISLDTTLERPMVPASHSGGLGRGVRTDAKPKRASWWRRLSGTAPPLAAVPERAPEHAPADRRLSAVPAAPPADRRLSAAAAAPPADRRFSGLPDTRADASHRRISLAGDARTAPRPLRQEQDDRQLAVHVGAVDQAALTTHHPATVMRDVMDVCQSMGLDIRRSRNSDYCIQCVRPKRPGLFRKLFASHKDEPSRAGQRWLTREHGTAPRASLSNDDASMGAIPTSTTGLSRLSMDDSTFLTPRTTPLYGDSSEDGGQEIRFTVELTRIPTLHGLYSVDIRRVKGNVWTYKYLYHALLERIELGGSLPTRR